MNKTLIILVSMAVVLLLPTIAATCTDSDEGPIDPSYPKEFLSKHGNTTVAKTVLSDYCMREKNGVKIKEGEWIKEYMCIGNLAVSKDYKCSDYGYDKCISDKGLAGCVKSGQTSITTPTVTAATPVNATKPKKTKVKLLPQCGDKQIQQDRGEECDPPGRLCVDADGFAGMCEKDCKCKAYKKEEVQPPEQIKPAEKTTLPAETQPAETKTEITGNEADKKEVKKEEPSAEKLPENTGFFARVLNWLSKTFS
ncbi:MAG: hypothetical protein HY363_06145 [Candidatus Aenigmarchaeota archaeon]|nr:hypothetical protein [Candidatus Aenigmarchaeota archaeon]